MARVLLEPRIVRAIRSVGNCRSGKKLIIAIALETILSTTETHTSPQNEPSNIIFSLFKENLAPVHKTDEEIACSSPLARATKEILLRLPAESVVQSKFVCKQWLRLIESESFIHSYFKHKNMDKKPKIMLVDKGTGRSGLSFAIWNSASHCSAFAVELEGVLCAALADPVANRLDVWKLEHGQWGRTCTVRLKAWPEYSLGTNVVAPMAVDPGDGRILLNTWRKIGLYDPIEQAIQELYSLDQSNDEIDRTDAKITPFVPMLYEEASPIIPVWSKQDGCADTMSNASCSSLK